MAASPLESSPFHIMHHSNILNTTQHTKFPSPTPAVFRPRVQESSPLYLGQRWRPILLQRVPVFGSMNPNELLVAYWEVCPNGGDDAYSYIHRSVANHPLTNSNDKFEQIRLMFAEYLYALYFFRICDEKDILGVAKFRMVMHQAMAYFKDRMDPDLFLETFTYCKNHVMIELMNEVDPLVGLQCPRQIIHVNV
jgi:hypothetical protein